MTKHEAPPFRMVIERGRLVPATAYDAERLDTYRTGSSVRVRFVEERDRWGIRKWWAVVNRAVKECPTPWKTASEASEAIKLALGIVNLTKTVGGEFMAYPKSLTELTDPELEEAVDQMLAVMFRVTGIDPDDWRKHIADIGQNEHEPSASSPADAAAAGEVAPSPHPAAAPLSGAEPGAPAQEAAGREGDASSETEKPADGLPAVSPSSKFRADVVHNLFALATDKTVTAKDAMLNIAEAAEEWAGRHPDMKEFVTTVYQTAKKVLKGELQVETARKYLEGLN